MPCGVRKFCTRKGSRRYCWSPMPGTCVGREVPSSTQASKWFRLRSASPPPRDSDQATAARRAGPGAHTPGLARGPRPALVSDKILVQLNSRNGALETERPLARKRQLHRANREQPRHRHGWRTRRRRTQPGTAADGDGACRHRRLHRLRRRHDPAQGAPAGAANASWKSKRSAQRRIQRCSRASISIS